MVHALFVYCVCFIVYVEEIKHDVQLKEFSIKLGTKYHRV